MYCPRLNHFVRLNQNGSIGKCGHMTTDKGFNSFAELENSEWLERVKTDMKFDIWPNECVRCMQTENLYGESIITKSIDLNIIGTANIVKLCKKKKKKINYF